MKNLVFEKQTNAHVYVIEDDESMRRALSMLLRANGYKVESFESAPAFFKFLKPEGPSCVILDVRLKGHSGLAVQEQFLDAKLDIPIIFMTAHGDIAMSVQAMKAGAVDFLAKPFRDQDMLDAVANALNNHARRIETARAEESLHTNYTALSSREKEVMAYVVKGLLNKQIAGKLDLNEVTIKFHRAQAMKKMGAKSLAEFVLQARMLGIVADPAAP
ncbi:MULTISPECIES: response regulator transcription factor [unclassified Cupriavidus]|uniref:response regulator transcription factor n=1 Tax=unclassified Cupriavidus TaxID=2640874 RepID=UPI0010F6426A|nr:MULTISPECIES: response regulator [unclassified Cupriavidus]MWL91166.1 response regulator [Cupriavidus sp. SW-Y-13]